MLLSLLALLVQKYKHRRAVEQVRRALAHTPRAQVTCFTQYKSTHTDAGAVEQDTSARAGGVGGGQAEAEELAALRGQVKAPIYALMEP